MPGSGDPFGCWRSQEQALTAWMPTGHRPLLLVRSLLHENRRPRWQPCCRTRDGRVGLVDHLELGVASSSFGAESASSGGTSASATWRSLSFSSNSVVNATCTRVQRAARVHPPVGGPDAISQPRPRRTCSRSLSRSRGSQAVVGRAVIPPRGSDPQSRGAQRLGPCGTTMRRSGCAPASLCGLKL